MIFSMHQIYLWAGLLGLGLADLYLARYPMFHPIVLVSAVSWLWKDLSNGLIVGAMLELIFGLAQQTDNRRLNLVLYAGGLTVYINSQTHNINLILSLTLALLLCVGVQLVMERLRDWLKWIFLLVISGAVVFIMPLGKELFGFIPVQFLNHISVAGEVLPWIFFAFAAVGLIKRSADVEIAIPAILVGSILNMKSFVWGPIVFVFIYYLLDAILKERSVPLLWWLDWGFLVLGAYFLLPNLLHNTIGVFFGVLVFNVLLVFREFAPLEIYLLIFVAGIILSKGGLLH